jgi:hypothetical protein
MLDGARLTWKTETEARGGNRGVVRVRKGEMDSKIWVEVEWECGI